LEHGHTVEEISERLSRPHKTAYLKDCVYGGIDGAVTTFAIVAGVHGAGFSPTIILALGIANVLADGFSMAASNYSATKAEYEDIERLRSVERRHIRDVPEGEREEIRQILSLKGLTGRTLEDAVVDVSSNEKTWIDMMLVDEYGKAPADPQPMRAALATFFSFMACGLVPLLPFLLSLSDPFPVAIVTTAITFFFIGLLKSNWSLSPWWRSGLETLLIGSAAAAIAYGAGHIVSLLTG
jgi:VIT1/CCC1 family predicted Fe2+/Mn2+ transporter